MQRRETGLRLSSCLLLLGWLVCAVCADGLVNEEVKRTLDLSTHLAKISAEILLANQGDSSVHSFTLALEPDLAPHLAYIGASVKGEEDEDESLELKETSVKGQRLAVKEQLKLRYKQPDN